MHIVIDARALEVIAAEMSMVNVVDNEVLPTLLNGFMRMIAQVSFDCAYGTKDYKIRGLSEGAVSQLFPREKCGLQGGGPF